MNLQELSWPDAKKYFGKGVILVPVGSTEQHGLHNQLGCDFMLAERIAREAAKKREVLVCPVMPFGISSHHRQFFGTIWIKPDTFRKYVQEVCESLEYHGARRIIIVNGHGGNTNALLDVVQGMRRKGVACALFDWWRARDERVDEQMEKILGKKAGLLEGHADAIETSLNMHLHPDLVRLEKAQDLEVEWSPSVHGGIINVDTIDFTPYGSIGFPTFSKPEAGKVMFDFAVNRLVKLVEWMEKEKMEKMTEKKHK